MNCKKTNRMEKEILNPNINNDKTSDFNSMVDLFEKLKIEFKVTEGRNSIKKFEFDKKITIDGIGYSFFYTEFYFLNEKFINHGAWE